MTQQKLIVVSNVANTAANLFFSLQPKTIALAGGSTPRSLYEKLAKYDYPWDETDIFFSDERCVPPTHHASNYRMATEALLSKVNARVHSVPEGSCNADYYERELEMVFGPGLPNFDLVLLGLGEDGHTASLFPGEPALKESTKLVVAVDRPDYRRLTMTLPVLSAAKTAVFLVSGSQKRGALQQLITGEDIPAAHVTAKEIVIIADHLAASKIT